LFLQKAKECCVTVSSRDDAPRYVVIADDLRRKIASGALGPGARIPTEEALAREYGVSRNTVRGALQSLETGGLITSGSGRAGRRVQARVLLEVHASTSESQARGDERRRTGGDTWTADNRDQGRVGTQEIRVEVAEASAWVAEKLEIPVGSVVVIRRLLRYSDGEPHNRNDTYFPGDIAEGTALMRPADIPQGAIALLGELGHPQEGWQDWDEARMPTPEEVRELRMATGFPVMLQVRAGYSLERPIRLAVTVWPGDRSVLIYKSGRTKWTGGCDDEG
jgi:GntR family transcriptional regulator